MTSAKSNRPAGPHQAIEARNEQERFAVELFDRLWDGYRSRVRHAASYEQVVQQAQGTFVNDHIAFRTFACQRPTTGIVCLSRIFEPLGYQAAGCYHFPDKHLTALHYQHPHPEFPKLFISELRVWQLSPQAQQAVLRSVQTHRPPPPDRTLAALEQDLQHNPQQNPEQRQQRMQELLDWIEELPWERPEKQDVLAVSQESQYAAWVLVHGYKVNHFTSLINSQGVEPLGDIEKTAEALRQAGVPMKAQIEGERGSKLRQTATEAVQIDVEVRDQGQPARMPWTYAYFELAERGEVPDPETGRPVRFDGFLGPQATQLFEMTRVRR